MTDTFNETAAPEGQEAPPDDGLDIGQSGTPLERAGAAAERARDAQGRFVAGDGHMDRGNDHDNVKDALAEMFARREARAAEVTDADLPMPSDILKEMGVDAYPIELTRDMSPREAAKALAEHRRTVQTEFVNNYMQAKTEQQAAAEPTPPQPEAAPGPTPQEELQRIRGEVAAQQELRDWYSRAPQAAWQTVSAMSEIEAQFKKQFADIQTDRDWAYLQQTDPNRAAQARGLAIAYQTANQQLQHIGDGMQRADQAAFKAYADAQDARFMKVHPEYADPQKAAGLQRAARDMLKSVGFDDADVARLWNSDRTFRSAEGQSIMAAAAAHYAAKANMKNAASRPLPNVQRPGVRQSEGGVSNYPRAGDIQKYQRQMERATGGSKDQIMAAIALHRARVGR